VSPKGTFFFYCAQVDLAPKIVGPNLAKRLSLTNFRAYDKNKKDFTPEERLSIIQEGQREGRSATVRKYDISPSLYDKWRHKYLNQGIEGLKNRYKRIDPAVRELQEENERLKRIIAKQALEIEVKTELLKNSYRTPQKMMLIDQYKEQAPVKDLCRWAMLPGSLYYYKPTQGLKEIMPSSHTGKKDGSMVPNEQVVDDIKTVLSGDFVCYGYHKVTLELRQMDYIINPKKFTG